MGTEASGQPRPPTACAPGDDHPTPEAVRQVSVLAHHVAVVLVMLAVTFLTLLIVMSVPMVE